MDRWTGVFKVSLNPNSGGPFFRVAASLLISPISKTLTVPSLNAIFFNGDRVEGTGNPVIERLSDSRNIAQLLVSKLGGCTNAWVLDASTFNGPFAVYKEFVPSVNSYGEPKCYNPDGFPASSSIVAILSKAIKQVRSVMSGSITEPRAAIMHSSTSPSPVTPPKTIILGFSKGGTVVNQVITELSQLRPESAENLIGSDKPSLESLHDALDPICPTSKAGLLLSISEFHYLDVGLNSTGAYLTDSSVVKKLAEKLLFSNSNLRFVLHGTPRQWCDQYRPWICREKDLMLQLLEEAARICEGRLQVTQRFYFANRPPSLQMHFEIIEDMNIS